MVRVRGRGRGRDRGGVGVRGRVRLTYTVAASPHTMMQAQLGMSVKADKHSAGAYLQYSAFRHGLQRQP